MSNPHAVTLTLANIQQVDNGKVAAAFNQALRQICDDIRDRPNDQTARKVIFTVEAKPQLERETGALDTIGLTYYVEPKLPKRRSRVYPVLPTSDNAMLFSPHSPNDPRQLDLYRAPEPTAPPEPREAPEGAREDEPEGDEYTEM